MVPGGGLISNCGGGGGLLLRSVSARGPGAGGRGAFRILLELLPSLSLPSPGGQRVDIHRGHLCHSHVDEVLGGFVASLPVACVLYS